MKRTALFTAVLTGLLAAGAGHFYLERLESEISGGQKVALLVASEDIPLGTALSEKSVVVRDVPEAYADSRQLRASDAKKAFGARVSSALRANDAVLWSDLASGDGRNRVLSSLVERGMRGVSIDTKVGAFDGLLRPGDRVDVLFTERSQSGVVGPTVTLLQNLLVLSVAGDLGKAAPADDKQPFRRFGSVTLSASVEAAELVTHARERGQLSLTLRNADDVSVREAVAPVTASSIERAELAARNSNGRTK